MAATIASNSQEWIASQLSATAVDARPSRTKWTYARDRNGMMVIEPVLGFYFNPPQNAKCRWSTEKGARPPHVITKGLSLPDRDLILWDDDKLESEAARIREKYWDEMRTLVAPQRFEDLYDYFDSATLFMCGAVNLWNLINLLANDARHNWREVEKHVASECNNWVLDWLEAFPDAASNRESLIKWDMKGDILTAVTSQFDWDNDLKALDLVGQNILRECFLYHFERLTGKKPNVARFNTHAADSKPIPAAQPMVAAAGTAAQASTSPNDSPLPSSAAQPLSTIPEEGAATKSAEKPQGLTIDTALAPQIPLQTVSAPATAVPRITVEPQPAKEAEDVPEKSERNDKTGDDFLTNQDLADRVQSTARQLSSQSTPGEKQDPTLNASTINTLPRTVSTAEATGVSQHAARPQRTFSDKAGTIPRNMYGNKTPFHGPPKSPQGYGPNRQQLSANLFALHGERASLQQRVPTGPSQQQHIMQALDPRSQAPPPGVLPPTSNQGMSSTTGCFPPSSTGLQLSVGMEPMFGMPGIDFQNQVQMRAPTMGQPQFGYPQASSTGTPSQYMGQQNVGTPMYQPNGYIPQSQKQPRREKGDKKKRHDDRRDSMNSTGSRNKKVRDDPIHGPVYALKSRKDSNTSTGRKLSNSDGSTAVDPKKSASNPNLDCRNYRFEGKWRNVASEFVDCPCFRCARSTRSLFVKHDQISMEQAQAALMNYLGSWGAEKVITLHDGYGSLVVFRSDRDAIRAMQDLCGRPNNGRDIPGMGRVSSLWYAFYSKHYTPPHDNPTGLPRGVLESRGLCRRSSSTLSRDSNVYRNQLPNNILSNTPSFGSYGPGLPPPHFWQGETVGPTSLNMVPVYQQLPQRVLWDPDSADQNRKASKAESKSKEGLEYQPKTYPKRPDGITALKEDWRSKPPAEEVIEDISSDEAVADSSSNASSQGARGIKICLPNETGSLRSRSVSPDVEDAPSAKQVQKDSTELKQSAGQEGDQAEGGARQDPKAELVAKDDGPTSSGYRKATAELAVPVEEFQPTPVAKLAQTMEMPKKGLTSYSKITSELTEATEDLDVNTVVRHKPPRSPLPEAWMTTPEQKPSNLQSRFGALTGALQLEALGQQVDSWVAEGTSAAGAPEPSKAEQAPVQKPKAKKTWNKSGRARRTTSKASNGTSASSSSTTATDAQSRGESRASNNRPMSRASSGRPESAADRTTQSPTHSQPTTKKKNTKSQRKPKQPPTAEPCAAPAGQTKIEDYQDQISKVSVKGSPTKTNTQQSGPSKVTQALSAAELAKVGDCTQSESVAQKHDDRKESSSGTKEGGSACLKKDRSPQKAPQNSDFHDERDSLQIQPLTDPPIALEASAGNDLNNCSPEANLFPNQKFTIDKVKRDSAMATPPMKNEDIRHRQTSAINFTTNDARIALPLLPPNSKISHWASVASRGPRSMSDDPFTSVKGEAQEEDWLRDKAVKTPQKPSSEPASHQTSPTPSPGKKADRQGIRNRLNAAAKAFEPLSIPASPAASVASALSAKAIPFHTKKPSLPGQKGPVEKRFITPAEQVVDTTSVTQPDRPAKEKKRVSPAPDHGGDGGQKGRAKSSGTASAATKSMKTAAQAASIVSMVSKLEDEEEFPTLAAAAVPQRRASSAVKTSMPGAGARSKTATTTAPKASPAAAAPAPSLKPPVTSPNNIKLGQRGDTSVPVPDKQGVSMGGEKSKAGDDQWTTVGSGKKAGGKKNSSNNNNNNKRTASGKSGGSATGQGGRVGAQGPRGGRAPVGEERKGG